MPTEPLPDSGRQTFGLIQAATPATLADELERVGEPFVLLLAMDASAVPTVDIDSLARAAMRGGLVYLCAWGPGCELVHDCFDLACVDLPLPPTRPWPTENWFAMTTWLADETLEEATWFFSHTAFPDEDGYTCRLWLAATVDNPVWAERIREALAAKSD